VKDPTITASASQIVDYPDSESGTLENFSEENAIKLGGNSFKQLRGATVYIMNESGVQIYAGEWSPERDREIFNRPGLYFYKIQKGASIQTGKIFKRGT
jgi:hypothetical protein